LTQRVVIADAGPLIALARIEALYLLRQLFGRVCITTTVRDEILPAKAAFADADLLVRMLAEGWIDVVALAQTDYRHSTRVSMQERPVPYKWQSTGVRQDTLCFW